MELLGDVGHVESHFSPFGDSVSVSVRQVHGLHQMYRRLRTCFGRTQWYFMVMRLKWMLDLICLEIVLIYVQHSCPVCAECTIGTEIILDAPDGNPR